MLNGLRTKLSAKVGAGDQIDIEWEDNGTDVDESETDGHRLRLRAGGRRRADQDGQKNQNA